jgi:hypothetical protein
LVVLCMSCHGRHHGGVPDNGRSVRDQRVAVGPKWSRQHNEWLMGWYRSELLSLLGHPAVVGHAPSCGRLPAAEAIARLLANPRATIERLRLLLDACRILVHIREKEVTEDVR